MGPGNWLGTLTSNKIWLLRWYSSEVHYRAVFKTYPICNEQVRIAKARHVCRQLAYLNHCLGVERTYTHILTSKFWKTGCVASKRSVCWFPLLLHLCQTSALLLSHPLPTGSHQSQKMVFSWNLFLPCNSVWPWTCCPLASVFWVLDHRQMYCISQSWCKAWLRFAM